MLGRVLLGALPLGLVVWVSLRAGTIAVDQQAYVGRDMFQTLTMLWIALAGLLPPVVVAAAVHQERQRQDDGTLDLLSLTSLSLRRIVDGVVHARVATLILAIAGSAPALALNMTLGGSGVWDVVTVVVAVLLLTWVGGWVSAAASTALPGVVAPTMLTWALMSVVLCLLGAIGIDAASRVVWQVTSVVAPLMTAFYARFLSVQFLVDGRRGSALDRDAQEVIASLGPRRAALALVIGGAVAGLSSLATLWWVLRDVPLADEAGYLLAPLVGGFVSMGVVGLVLEVAAAIVAARRVLSERDPDLQWRRGPVRRTMRWMRREVRGPAVLWREVVTRGTGPVVPWWLAGAAVWVVALPLVWAWMERPPRQVVSSAMLLVLVVVCVTVLIGPVLASLTWSGERRADVGRLLLLTNQHPLAIVLGKGLGVGTRLLPALSVLVPALLLVLWLWPRGFPWFALAVCLAYAVFWHGVFHGVALRVRPAGNAWIVGMGVAVVAVVAVPLLTAVLAPRAEWLTALAWPPLALVPRFVRAGASPPLLALAWLPLAPLPWLLITMAPGALAAARSLIPPEPAWLHVHPVDTRPHRTPGDRMSTAPDLYYNKLGKVMVVAPTAEGVFSPVASYRQVALQRDTGEVGPALARWIFADLPRDTLRDQWGNPYDHAVHTLVVGTLADGEAFLASFAEAGYRIAPAEQLFVPFQTVVLDDAEDSDQLRQRHPRAFALAFRSLTTPAMLIMHARDRALLGS